MEISSSFTTRFDLEGDQTGLSTELQSCSPMSHATPVKISASTCVRLILNDFLSEQVSSMNIHIKITYSHIINNLIKLS